MRGCSIEGGMRPFLGELPLRGAARLKEGGESFWGTCRCAGLMDQGWRRPFLGELPFCAGALGELLLRGAA